MNRPPEGEEARRAPRPQSLWRYVAVAAGCLAALVLLASQQWYRGMEASLAGDAVSTWLGFPVIVAPRQQTVFFAFHGTGAAHMLGLQVTLGCSSVLLLALLAMMSGILLTLRDLSLIRVLAASLSAAAIIVVVNTLRLVLIAVLVDWWGPQTGFGWGHTLFGSVLMLAGLAAALLAFIKVLKFGRGVRVQSA